MGRSFIRNIGLTWIFVFLLLPVAQTQLVFRGIVVDATSQQPLEGVTVMLLPAKTQRITEKLGRFNIRQLKAPTTDILFSSVGYES
ncbi:MAG: carboxypeptidase-like regulatory domain-containing protein [Bacteroidota bacterium]